MSLSVRRTPVSISFFSFFCIRSTVRSCSCAANHAPMEAGRADTAGAPRSRDTVNRGDTPRREDPCALTADVTHGHALTVPRPASGNGTKPRTSGQSSFASLSSLVSLPHGVLATTCTELARVLLVPHNVPTFPHEASRVLRIPNRTRASRNPRRARHGVKPQQGHARSTAAGVAALGERCVVTLTAAVS